MRFDNNSLFGSFINPRLAAIYSFNNTSALKLIYGEAFQEPAPMQMFGGWSGRNANPDLVPERVKNIEAS